MASSQKYPGNNLTALLLGTAEFSFSPDASSVTDANGKGYISFGNIVAFTPSVEPTIVEHFGSYQGIKTKDKTVVTQTKLEYQLRCDEWNRETLKTLFAATQGANHTQSEYTADAVDNMIFTAGSPSSPERWYDVKYNGAHIYHSTTVTMAVAAAIDVTAYPDPGFDSFTTVAAHGFTAGTRVKFGGTAVPTGLSGSTVYYVIEPSEFEFKVSATLGGSAVNITSAGTDVTVEVALVEGTDWEIDLVNGRIRFINHISQTVIPTVTAPAITATDAKSYMKLTPFGDAVKTGYGKLIVYDQDSTNEIVLRHTDFSCEVRVESASELSGNDFTDMTLIVSVTSTMGTVELRQDNDMSGV